MNDRSSERHVRWQDYRIQQFTFANNLFLTFSVAAIGYWMSLLTDPGFEPTGIGRSTFFWALILLAGSAIAGSGVVLLRLWDFRLTSELIMDEAKNTTARRTATKWLGLLSWSTFHAQVVLFVFGVERLTQSLFYVHGHKLSCAL